MIPNKNLIVKYFVTNIFEDTNVYNILYSKDNMLELKYLSSISTLRACLVRRIKVDWRILGENKLIFL